MKATSRAPDMIRCRPPHSWLFATLNEYGVGAGEANGHRSELPPTCTVKVELGRTEPTMPPPYSSAAQHWQWSVAMRVSVAEADVAKPVKDGVPMSEQVFTFADKPLLFEIRMATDDDEGEALGVARCSG